MQHRRQTKNADSNLVGKKDQGSLQRGVSSVLFINRDTYSNHTKLLPTIRIVDLPRVIVAGIWVCGCTRDLPIRLRGNFFFFTAMIGVLHTVRATKVVVVSRHLLSHDVFRQKSKMEIRNEHRPISCER